MKKKYFFCHHNRTLKNNSKLSENNSVCIPEKVWLCEIRRVVSVSWWVLRELPKKEVDGGIERRGGEKIFKKGGQTRSRDRCLKNGALEHTYK